MNEAFAIVGAFATFVAAAIMLGAVVVAVATSISNWIQAKRELVRGTKNLAETQCLLMEANNKLNERVMALEKKGKE